MAGVFLVFGGRKMVGFFLEMRHFLKGIFDIF